MFMPLKGLDLLVCLKIAVMESPSWTYAQAGEALGLSASETHVAVRRSAAAGLLVPPADQGQKPSAQVQALLEFIEHGVRYAFYAVPGTIRRGMPTAHSAPPLNAEILDAEAPLVWPDPEGAVRGQELRPLYRTAPFAARKDARLYAVLSLVDALRVGRVRERRRAMELLSARLLNPHGD
jgi:hypothetical protein